MFFARTCIKVCRNHKSQIKISLIKRPTLTISCAICLVLLTSRTTFASLMTAYRVLPLHRLEEMMKNVRNSSHNAKAPVLKDLSGISDGMLFSTTAVGHVNEKPHRAAYTPLLELRVYYVVLAFFQKTAVSCITPHIKLQQMEKICLFLLQLTIAQISG